MYKDVLKPVSYTCPNGKNKWILYFDIPKGKSHDEIAFFPICKVEFNRQAYYVNFNMDSLDSVSNHFLRIYSSHFISRFKERKEYEYLNSEDALAAFHYDGGTYVYNFGDKELEVMRLINFHGFSIGRYLKKGNVMYFDTFVTKEMLKDDQKLWIKELISYGIKHHQMFSPSETDKSKEVMMLYPTWHELIDKVELFISFYLNSLKEFSHKKTIIKGCE